MVSTLCGIEKKEAAIDEYGTEGENGVIKITMKK